LAVTRQLISPNAAYCATASYGFIDGFAVVDDAAYDDIRAMLATVEVLDADRGPRRAAMRPAVWRLPAVESGMVV
jgi:hypothetical protein